MLSNFLRLDCLKVLIEVVGEVQDLGLSQTLPQVVQQVLGSPCKGEPIMPLPDHQLLCCSLEFGLKTWPCYRYILW